MPADPEATPAHPSASASLSDRPTRDALPGAFVMGGKVGGRYRIEGHLGRGAFGAVYHASDELLGRAVALKALHVHRAGTPAALQEFLREARTIARLDH